MKLSSQCLVRVLIFCINGISELIIMNQLTGQRGQQSYILKVAKSSTGCPVCRPCYLFLFPEALVLVFWILLVG